MNVSDIPALDLEKALSTMDAERKTNDIRGISMLALVHPQQLKESWQDLIPHMSGEMRGIVEKGIKHQTVVRHYPNGFGEGSAFAIAYLRPDGATDIFFAAFDPMQKAIWDAVEATPDLKEPKDYFYAALTVTKDLHVFYFTPDGRIDSNLVPREMTAHQIPANNYYFARKAQQAKVPGAPKTRKRNRWRA